MVVGFEDSKKNNPSQPQDVGGEGFLFNLRNEREKGEFFP
jgi:hypothetical protein